MDLLFFRKSLSQLLDKCVELIRTEIDEWPENKVLTIPEAQLINPLVDKYTLLVPTLHPRDDWRVDHTDMQISVLNDLLRFSREDGRSLTVPGQRITVHIPFEGDSKLFEFKPSTFDLNPPRAKIDSINSVICFMVDVGRDSANAKRIKQEIDGLVKSIEKYLERVRQDCQRWNDSLEYTVTAQVAKRKCRLAEQANLVAELNIPLKRRSDSGKGVSIPVKAKRRPKILLPEVPREQYRPNPVIAEDDYVEILGIISRLALSIERSQTTFARMNESHIRDHILVSLNGHYEGSATGETFNGLGKTDLLIREQNQNVFVGECKFWKGPKLFTEAIDQLLGYVTWRDTKTALVVFVKHKNFTSALSKINESALGHTNCRQGPLTITESQFRYIFHQKSDEARDVHLSVLAFHIPSSIDANEVEG